MPEPLTSTLLELVEKLEMIGLKRKEFAAAVRDDSDSDYTDSEDTECELEKCSPDELIKRTEILVVAAAAPAHADHPPPRCYCHPNRSH